MHTADQMYVASVTIQDCGGKRSSRVGMGAQRESVKRVLHVTPHPPGVFSYTNRNLYFLLSRFSSSFSSLLTRYDSRIFCMALL